MRPMLDDLELVQVQAITTCDRRSLVEHKPPRMSGSLLQNLGRQATRLLVWGVVSGTGSQEFAKKLDEKFRRGTPVPFTSDIAADSGIDQVLIDDVRIQELAGKPERFGYVLVLREFIKPVEPADAAGLDAGVLDDAQGLVSGLVDGLSGAQAFATGLGKFVPVFSGLLGKLQGAGG